MEKVCVVAGQGKCTLGDCICVGKLKLKNLTSTLGVICHSCDVEDPKDDKAEYVQLCIFLQVADYWS
jgi:hypothetical protein